MALVSCYECGKEISDAAPACPSCGAPKRGPVPAPLAAPAKYQWTAGRVAIAVFASLLILWFTGALPSCIACVSQSKWMQN